ncbi:MAG: CmpA/NrtA family ABC transporter substrate-binding protein [Akkermansiaceae bacterium]|nr:CmpA/NrtA family ABC transporter substrate-binding protein [Akkermansiaceae bacterium]
MSVSSSQSDKGQNAASGASASPLKLGFVPMFDCAPIAIAHELGLFDRYDLQVELSREGDWNAIRDKIYSRQLDASQSIAGMAFALGMGFPELRCDVAVPLILNLHGNAITLSSRLDPMEIAHGEGLALWLRKHPQLTPLTFATSHPFSSHHILLRQWLGHQGLNDHPQVKVEFHPAHRMPDLLVDGSIDGFCVGEPWNSKAVLSGDAWSAANPRLVDGTSAEKVLLMSGRLLSKRRDEAIRLVAALIESCRLCQDPDFGETLVHVLSQRKYTGIAPEVLRHELDGSLLHDGHRRAYNIFHGEEVNRPTVSRASWVLAGLTSIAALPQITAGSLSRIYREDLYLEALKLCMS